MSMSYKTILETFLFPLATNECSIDIPIYEGELEATSIGQRNVRLASHA